jgi:hypothetical protein
VQILTFQTFYVALIVTPFLSNGVAIRDTGRRPLTEWFSNFPARKAGFSLRWIKLRELRRWSRRIEALYMPLFERFCVKQIS